MPFLSKILIFPIKSLDGVEVTQASLLEGGAIAYDREFAILDEQGKFVNGKRTEKVHALRSSFDLAARTVTLRVHNQSQFQTFHLDRERNALASWLSDYFGYTVTLQQNLYMGFPDDTEASGPTVISTATLETITSWFPGLSLEEIRHRVRANLEIDGVPAFWEDQLFAKLGQCVPFQIGDVAFVGSNPCQRCVVLTRNPWTGKRDSSFQKEFTIKRQQTLPNWAELSRFNHFFRLTVNTKVPPSETGKVLQIADEIKILQSQAIHSAASDEGNTKLPG